MTVLWIVIAAMFIFALAGLFVGLSRDLEGAAATGAVVGVVAIILGIIAGFMTAMPKYNLWKAEIERQTIVVEARQKAEAAVEEARAEVARARGTAESNRIVADSIDEQYLRYLYIISLAESNNQIIYIPTEAGLPILEAERFGENRGR